MPGDRISIRGLFSALDGPQTFHVENASTGLAFHVSSHLNSRERELIKKGGLLPYTKEKAGV